MRESRGTDCPLLQAADPLGNRKKARGLGRDEAEVKHAWSSIIAQQNSLLIGEKNFP